MFSNHLNPLADSSSQMSLEVPSGGAICQTAKCLEREREKWDEIVEVEWNVEW